MGCTNKCRSGIVPSKYKQVQLRSPALRSKFGVKADAVLRALLSNPKIIDPLLKEVCPVCKKPFEECSYMQSLDED